MTLLDGGTGGFHLLSDFPRALTSHDIGLRDLMQSAELIGDLPEIHLVTINITEFNEVRIGLSKTITKSLPVVYKKVQKILQEMNQRV